MLVFLLDLYAHAHSCIFSRYVCVCVCVCMCVAPSQFKSMCVCVCVCVRRYTSMWSSFIRACRSCRVVSVIVVVSLSKSSSPTSHHQASKPLSLTVLGVPTTAFNIYWGIYWYVRSSQQAWPTNRIVSHATCPFADNNRHQTTKDTIHARQHRYVGNIQHFRNRVQNVWELRYIPILCVMF